jgi:hypothetical protein
MPPVARTAATKGKGTVTPRIAGNDAAVTVTRRRVMPCRAGPAR